MQFILNRYRDPLEPGDHGFKSHMVPDLGDEVVIPMPGKAGDDGMRRKFCRNLQAANMN